MSPGEFYGLVKFIALALGFLTIIVIFLHMALERRGE